MSHRPTVLVTGASSGIGAVYADRFARRGHDLVLVARDRGRLAEVAERVGVSTGVAVDVLPADLADPVDLAGVEDRLRDDERIGVLVNNAGAAAPGAFTAIGTTGATELIDVNVTAPTRLTSAVVPRLVAAGRGAVVTVGSMVGFMPDYGQAVYGATKSFLLHLSRSLHHELAPQGVYVQAVLPAATRTGIFTRTGRDVTAIPGMMEADDLVDAALVGFDRGEAVTMPSLPDEAHWDRYARAEAEMAATAAQGEPAVRYRPADPAPPAPVPTSPMS